MRQSFSSDSPWERVVAYSRAVRAGDLICVAGTTAVDGEGNVVAPGDPAGQTRYILEKISAILTRAGSGLHDVVRTRMYVIDITRWPEIGRVHAEFFAGILPAATMVQVSGLIHPDVLIEIEVDAVADGGELPR